MFGFNLINILVKELCELNYGKLYFRALWALSDPSKAPLLVRLNISPLPTKRKRNKEINSYETLILIVLAFIDPGSIIVTKVRFLLIKGWIKRPTGLFVKMV